MLVNPHANGEAPLVPEQPDAAQQKYETMQCFAVTEPKSIKEEGEGKLWFWWLLVLDLHLRETPHSFSLFIFPVLSPLLFWVFTSLYLSYLPLFDFPTAWWISFCNILHLCSFILHFLSLFHQSSWPRPPSLLCPVLLPSPLLPAFPPLHWERLISAWHFVSFPSNQISFTHTHKGEECVCHSNFRRLTTRYFANLIPDTRRISGGQIEGCRLKLSLV